MTTPFTSSQQLALLWVELQTVQRQLDTVILPLALHLGMAQTDPALATVLAACTERIAAHWAQFRLQEIAPPPIS